MSKRKTAVRSTTWTPDEARVVSFEEARRDFVPGNTALIVDKLSGLAALRQARRPGATSSRSRRILTEPLFDATADAFAEIVMPKLARDSTLRWEHADSLSKWFDRPMPGWADGIWKLQGIMSHCRCIRPIDGPAHGYAADEFALVTQRPWFRGTVQPWEPVREGGWTAVRIPVGPTYDDARAAVWLIAPCRMLRREWGGSEHEPQLGPVVERDLYGLPLRRTADGHLSYHTKPVRRTEDGRGFEFGAAPVFQPTAAEVEHALA